MNDLEVNLVHKIKSAIPLNKNITPADADSLKAKVLNMLKTKKKQENRKEIVEKTVNLLKSLSTNKEKSDDTIMEILNMIENPTKKYDSTNQFRHETRIDLNKQIPVSRNNAIKLLNAGLDQNPQLVYLKKHIIKIAHERKINSIFFQENEQELIIWINPYCTFDEYKFEQTTLLPRRLYIWILSIVNTRTKILYHSVKVDRGKEIPNVEQIKFMKDICRIHDLDFYHILKTEKFNIIKIVLCNKTISLQELPKAIDEYLLLNTSILHMIKTIDISDNDNQFSIIFNKNKYAVIVQYNDALFDEYRDFSITAFHIIMSKIGKNKWVKVKYNSNLSSITQIKEIYSSIFYNNFLKI